MEPGGNAPFIVFDDADLDRAVEGALLSKFRNAGQTCVCTNRIIVQSGIHDAFIDRFASKVSRLRVGSGTEPGVEQGPLIDEHAVRKVEELLQDATTKGATGATGGHRYSMGGLFFESTVVRDASVDMRVMKEEIFGPVAPVFRFTEEEEAIALANDTEFGLAGYFYTQNLARAHRVAERLEYGMVGITTRAAGYGIAERRMNGPRRTGSSKAVSWPGSASCDAATARMPDGAELKKQALSVEKR